MNIWSADWNRINVKTKDGAECDCELNENGRIITSNDPEKLIHHFSLPKRVASWIVADGKSIKIFLCCTGNKKRSNWWALIGDSRTVMNWCEWLRWLVSCDERSYIITKTLPKIQIISLSQKLSNQNTGAMCTITKSGANNRNDS